MADQLVDQISHRSGKKKSGGSIHGQEIRSSDFGRFWPEHVVQDLLVPDTLRPKYRSDGPQITSITSADTSSSFPYSYIFAKPFGSKALG